MTKQSLIQRLLSYPQRLRRSKGFGVHSPFAYKFITTVLCMKDCEYYAYPEIAGFCPRARKAGFNEIFAGRDMVVSEAQLIFRILCHFNSSRCIEMGHGHEVTNIIFKRAVPNAKVIRWTTDREIDITPSDNTKNFILVNQISDFEVDQVRAFIREALADGNSVVVVRNIRNYPLQAKAWQAIVDSKHPGIGFTDGHIGIFVADPGFTHCIYDIVL